MASADLQAREARLFGRYLLDRNPPDDLVERYVAATTELFPDVPTGDDAAMLQFVDRHPAALAFVDAACGLLRPASLLRKKLLLMAAILEASVHYAPEFLAPPPGRVRTTLLLTWYGMSAGIKFVIGAALIATISARADQR